MWGWLSLTQIQVENFDLPSQLAKKPIELCGILNQFGFEFGFFTPFNFHSYYNVSDRSFGRSIGRSIGRSFQLLFQISNRAKSPFLCGSSSAFPTRRDFGNSLLVSKINKENTVQLRSKVIASEVVHES